MTEVQEDLKKLGMIRYWVRKATPAQRESKEPPKKQPIKEVLQDKADEKKHKEPPGADETQTTGYNFNRHLPFSDQRMIGAFSLGGID